MGADLDGLAEIRWWAVDELASIERLAPGNLATLLPPILRGEYPEARHRLDHALAEARARGFRGGDVMGEGFSFEI